MSRAGEGTEPLTDLEKQAHRESQEARDALCDTELNIERMKITALRLRAVALEARKWAPVGDSVHFNEDERLLVTALKDLDWHDEHHGVWVHIDEAKRRGLPTYDSAEVMAVAEAKL